MRKSRINKFDPFKRQDLSALQAAAGQGNDREVRRLLRSGEPADQADSNGLTPLHFAAASGRTAVIRDLLSLGGASINLADAEGRTPLYLAAQNNDIIAMHVLLKAGADVTRKADSGMTAEELARDEQRDSVEETLRLARLYSFSQSSSRSR